MRFGEVALSGSRLAFWSISPILAMTASIPFLSPLEWTPGKIAFAAIWPLACFLGILALYDPKVRFRWAARCVTGIIFLACAFYVVDQFFLRNQPLKPAPRGQPSPLNSIYALVIIGLPSLWFALTGSFEPPNRSRPAPKPLSLAPIPRPGPGSAPDNPIAGR